MARRAKVKYGNGGNGANLGFEATMWEVADKLRTNMDAASRALTLSDQTGS